MDTKRRKISIAKTSTLVIGKAIAPNQGQQQQQPQEDCKQISINQQSNSNLQPSSRSSTISYRLVPLTSSTPNSSNISTTSNSGQVLVMMPNNREVLNSNVFIKRSPPEDSFSKTVIDQKRRVMHKEIERRRRDKINDWIGRLAKQVPDCASDRTKQGQSKGGILAKTAKYIEDLRTENKKINDILKEKDELSTELERLRQHCSRLEADNAKLASLLQENNIPIVDNN